MHPLLHVNTSDITGLRFTSTFTGKEFFLADHVLKGRRVMPGVAHLEMARAAVKIATGSETEIQLKNIVWARLVAINKDPLKLNISLFAEDNGEISFEIFEESNESPVVFSQGSALLMDSHVPPKLDLISLQAKCDQEIIEPERCYETFMRQGLNYGPGFRVIEKIYTGNDCALAKLFLPSIASENQKDFVLHPSLMDGALQASLGLSSSNEGNGSQISLPFALESLEMFGKCTDSMWAYVRGGNRDSGIEKLDIDLCDDEGNIYVRMRGFTSRILEDTEVAGILLLHPSWKEK
ncbi:MAG: hypothetical protein OMM_09608, partial [Candidatus Magnetoglobus multicellularis str. Araruama]